MSGSGPCRTIWLRTCRSHSTQKGPRVRRRRLEEPTARGRRLSERMVKGGRLKGRRPEVGWDRDNLWRLLTDNWDVPVLPFGNTLVDLAIEIRYSIARLP